ncbi:MAG: aldo/keto reductase, partial [Spirochaetaceae bacterium]|nr:aldo/keto reductase [Spirochaetaceae bacterium]
MQYRTGKKSGNSLSVLGLGCMRFSRGKAESIVMASVERGINYFDTAWMYPGNEEALGAALKKNRVRDKVFIATKLPVMLVKKQEDCNRFFSESLKRLKTHYIDYYLMHMLTDLASWEYLVRLGIKDWIAVKKKGGEIKQVGFSFHGMGEEFIKILDAYPWDFCQIQYNYSNENYQAGIRGLKKAAQTMPVIIMEPLLGGKLAGGLPSAAKAIFRHAVSGAAAAGKTAAASPAAWGLRWLWNQEETTVILSGMTDPAQVEENAVLAGACTAGSLSAEELEVYRRVRDVFNASFRIRCTSCAYCMPCPRGVNIPGCFAAYNASFTIGWVTGMQQYITSTAAVSAKPSGTGNCTACGACESRCPQKLSVIAGLKQVRKRMEPLFVRIIVAAARKLLGRR